MPSKKKLNILEDKESTSKFVCRLPLLPGETPSKPTSLNEITWRIFRIMAEFVEGFQFLSESSREVTFFGSARTKKTDRWYKEGVKLGRLLAEHGFTVITGGGPGIMEALNKGAKEGGGVSIGLNIQLPNEQRINPYVTRGRGFHYFFTRKVMLAASAQAYVYFPGGFGTLDELFEIVTLIQTGKMQSTPVVCVGKEFWTGLFNWVDTVQVAKYKTITAKERKLVQIVDSAQEAFEIICGSEERSFF
ncbi:MAG: TIGR00730 family Rossman fold protein [Candidatus Uhrbacteria bacterium]|nr:TIGR00730 family Rossman fold protein [Candidatus Uhrbacteria bacterium]